MIRIRFLRLLPVGVAWLVGLVALVSQAAAATDDDAFLSGLRSRRLYELAEKYCTDRLAGEDLDASRRANLTIELSRTLAEHALDAPKKDAAPLWRQATDVVDRFVAAHPRSARLMLVRLQGALALAAQGKAARLSAAANDNAPATVARDVLRRAIGELRKLNQQIETELRQRGRAADAPGQLATAELQSLQLNVQYELGRALMDQALCYPPASPDRINALSQASAALAAVTRQDLQTSLIFSASLEEIACWRLMDEFSLASRKLAELAKAPLDDDLAQRLRAERIHLALARGQIDEALSEAGASGQQPTGPEAAFARLEALLAAWRRATQHRAADSADWQHRVLEQAQQIGQLYGPRWMRRSETLLARAMAGATGKKTAETLAFAAAGYYRGGQLDKALATYDEAVRRARADEQDDEARQLALTAATIEKERGHYRDALNRYRTLALDAPQAPQAAEAHLLAVYCAAQLAQAEPSPKLDEYERLLREHLATWPDGPTAAQAWCWLGRLAEHRRAWQQAIELLAHVESDDAQFAEAVEATGRCYESWLDELDDRDEDRPRLADDALARLEQIAAAADKPGARPDAATRAATLAAARIWLKEISTGALPAERLLRGLLDHDPDAPAQCQATARMLLIPALAAQGKAAQAGELVDQLPRDDTASRLAVLELLASIRRHAQGDAAKSADVELSIQNDLIARGGALDADTLRAVRREHALTLGETGRRQQGLQALEVLRASFRATAKRTRPLPRYCPRATTPTFARRSRSGATWPATAARGRRWFRAHYGLAHAQLKLGQASDARQTIEHVAKRYPNFDGGALQHKFEQLSSEVGAR